MRILTYKILHNINMLGLLLSIFVTYGCNQGVKERMVHIENVATHYNGEGYAGSETCKVCHSVIYKEQRRTAHFNTSQLADNDNILGDFSKDNKVHLDNDISFVLSKEGGMNYQLGFIGDSLVRKEPIDIIIGSGTKGQTYLYWHRAWLKQLPISYRIAEEKWVNSPGFPNDGIDFDRNIQPNCLECHTTWAKNHTPNDFWSGAYVKDEMMLGISCEGCHGPASKHVVFHKNNPEKVSARYILDIASLQRQQRLDACAKCHSGLRDPLKPPFSYVTGDKLDSFSKPLYSEDEVGMLDVHGNQYGLLIASECFKMSEGMDCSTCHNPHKNERGNLQGFSMKCVGCHGTLEGTHSTIKEKGTLDNCIECHMPRLKSASLTFSATRNTKDDSLRVRTHKIDTYEKTSDEYIKLFMEKTENRVQENKIEKSI